MPFPTFGSDGSGPYLRIPKASESEGWSVTISPLEKSPLYFVLHTFDPIQGQAPIRLRDGSQRPRDRAQYVVCPGFVGRLKTDGTKPEEDPAGVEICKSIKLPNGISLHETPYDLPPYGGEPIKLQLPVYNHTLRQYQILSQFAASSIWTGILELLGREKVQEMPDISAARFTITPNMEVRRSGQKTRRGWNVQASIGEPVPWEEGMGPDWEEVQRRLIKPLTPEAIVQKLGIEVYNKQYATQTPAQEPRIGHAPPNPAPDYTGDPFGEGPVGTDEDPFADPADDDPFL